MSIYDVVIIGGGHNGLVASAYLSKAGLKTLVVERRGINGGMAATENIFPGYKINTGAIVVGRLRPGLEEDLQLKSFGLKFMQWDPISFTPLPDGRHFFMYRDITKNCEQIAKFSKKDSIQYPKFVKFISEFANDIESLVWSPARSLTEIIERLETVDRGDLARFLTTSTKDILDEYFESDEIKGTLSWHTTDSTNAGPMSAGSAWELGAHFVIWKDFRIAVGGIGNVSDAISKSAVNLGAEIRNNLQVTKIIVDNGQVKGVKTSSGKIINSKCVISNLDPKSTFLHLIERDDLPENIFNQVNRIKCHGVGTKIICLLDKLPNFKSISDKKSLDHYRLFNIMPSLDYVEKAWDAAKYGKLPDNPMIQGYIPTITDSSLAPPNKHILEAWTQYTPYNLKEDTWDNMREVHYENFLRTMSEYTTNMREVISDKMMLTPRDFEKRFFVTEGQANQIDMGINQRLTWSDNRTDIKGLYLCGATCTPAGVNGAPGYNAAEAVISDWKNL